MSLSRQVLLILVTLGAALAVSCAAVVQQQVPLQCPPTPNKNPSIVIVTVVDGKAVPFPDRVHADSRAGKHDGQPVPSVITWFGPSGLQVRMQDPGCVEKDVKCNGDHCHANTNVKIMDKPVECKYQVWVEGVTQPYDPVVVVDNCCDNAM